MYTSALLDETDVKVVYDQQGNKREVLLSYEKYATLVEFVKRYTRTHRQESPQVQENATSQIGWEIFNALGRDAQPTEDPFMGMFAQEPELIDQIVATAMQSRETTPLRVLNG